MLVLEAAEVLTGITATGTVNVTLYGDAVSSAGNNTYQKLAQVMLTSAGETIYTVPAATAALVKSIHVADGGSGSTGVQLSNAGVPITGTFTLGAGGWSVYAQGGWQFFSSAGALVTSGQTGPTGVQGVQGSQGQPLVWAEDADEAYPIPGTQGAGGAQGVKGIQGDQGQPLVWAEDADEAYPIPGTQGAGGAQGAQGVQGQPGAQGQPLVWAEDADEALPIPGPQGAGGAQGAQGIQGNQGVQGMQGVPVTWAEDGDEAWPVNPGGGAASGAAGVAAYAITGNTQGATSSFSNSTLTLGATNNVTLSISTAAANADTVWINGPQLSLFTLDPGNGATGSLQLGANGEFTFEPFVLPTEMLLSRINLVANQTLQFGASLVSSTQSQSASASNSTGVTAYLLTRGAGASSSNMYNFMSTTYGISATQSLSNSSSSFTGSMTLSVPVGVSNNGAVSYGSTSYTTTTLSASFVTSQGSLSLPSMFFVPMMTTLPAGEYWFGLGATTANTSFIGVALPTFLANSFMPGVYVPDRLFGFTSVVGGGDVAIAPYIGAELTLGMTSTTSWPISSFGSITHRLYAELCGYQVGTNDLG